MSAYGFVPVPLDCIAILKKRKKASGVPIGRQVEFMIRSDDLAKMAAKLVGEAAP